MRLAVRMTTLVGLSAALLFGGAGAWQLRQEEADLRAAARSEALLLGRALQIGVRNALRDLQLEDVKETLEVLQRVDPEVEIFVFDEAGVIVGSSSGAVANEHTHRVSARARGVTEPIVELDSSKTTEYLVLGLRLREEEPQGSSAIVLEKPLTELRRDLNATRRDIVTTIVFFVLAVAGLTWGLSRRYIGRPLDNLITNMRRVRAGQLDVAFEGRDTDEVGATHREFEELVRTLENTRLRADQELEARHRLERGLQQADKLITLGQLSAVLAHEIGSPLQILEGRARSLLKTPDKPSVERVVPVIVEQTERITRIVQQLLEITRKRSPVRGRVDLAKAAQSVVDLLELEARRNKVRIDLHRQGDTDLHADGDQLQQIVLNLVRNAIQASPEMSCVEIGISSEQHLVVLQVRDLGPGVPPDIAEKLFEPFFTTRSTHGGTGLGLSVVKTIVQEHHGEVEFIPQNVGALVRVKLPRDNP
jgi:signal transduction histidine kinase